MQTQLNFKAPSVQLRNLNNLWFQLSNVSCNLKCKHCYLSCMPTSKNRFLPLDKIKNALEDSKKLKIQEIYLTGGEPLLHPDINNIIRMGLKHANVTIVSNGTQINDKKAKFLRQIEMDNDNEIIFRISIDHYLEEKNDEIRGKGIFKKAFTGVENLIRHGFNPIISAVNMWDEDEASFKEGFFALFRKINFEPDDINVKVIPPLKMGEYAKNYADYDDEHEIVTSEGIQEADTNRFDCATTRVITEKGVWSCPALVNDLRGKVGSTLLDSADKFFLETSACYTCQKHNKGIFNNNWAS